MYGNGYPYIPPAPPPPPRKPGLPPLAIAGIALGVAGILGVGSCVVLGGLYALGASAEAEPSSDPASANEPSKRATVNPAGTTGATPPTSGGGAAAPQGTAGKTWNLADEDDGNANDSDDDGKALADKPSATGKSALADGKGGSAPTPAATGTSTSPSGSGGSGSPRWFCNATGLVRVCGFANVCSNQMVSGSGFGSDRMIASMTAKNACEGMARAKGGFGTCTVSCSVR